MLFLLFTVASAQIFNHELRRLPEKRRQEQINAEVEQRYKRIYDDIINQATDNHTKISFHLYCTEPNKEENEFVLYENSYRLRQALYEDNKDRTGEGLSSSNKLLPKPECNVNDGYKLWELPFVHGQLQQFNTLLDKRQVYITRIFKKVKHDFPDIQLSISTNRPAYKGIFKNDCCPLYILKW
jgi:hypothetical protein